MSVMLRDKQISKVSIPVCLPSGFLMHAPTFLGFSPKLEWEDTVNYSVCALSPVILPITLGKTAGCVEMNG